MAGFSIIEEFSERNWGCIQGTSSEAMYQIERLEEEDPEFKVDPSIESREALRLRVKRGLEIAFQLHPEPVIVSHGRLFLALLEVLQIPIMRQIKNLCLLEITKTPQGWCLEEVDFNKECV